MEQTTSPQTPLIISKKPKNFFRRNSLPMKKGSMRYLIINTIILAIFMNFWFFPIIFKTYGIYLGCISIPILVLINYISSIIINNISDFTKKTNYFKILEELLSEKLSYFLVISFSCDYLGYILMLILIPYKIFLYILFYSGYIDDDLVVDLETLEFKEYSKEIILYRLGFIVGNFIFMVYFYLKKNLDNLKYLIYFFVFFFSILFIWIFVDLNIFRNYYDKNHKREVDYYPKFNTRMISLSFFFVTTLYIQSNLLTIKKELLNPTKKRMKKVINISFIFFTIFSFIFGFFGYYSLGNTYTTDIFFLRKTIPGKKFEIIYRILLAIIAILISLYSSLINITLKNFLLKNLKICKNFYFVSLAPLILMCIISFCYPKVIGVLGFVSCLVNSTNGYVLPTLAGIVVERKKGHKFRVFFYSVYLFVVVSMALSSFVFLCI